MQAGGEEKGDAKAVMRKREGLQRWAAAALVLFLICAVPGTKASAATDTSSWFRLLAVGTDLTIWLNGTELSARAKRVGDTVIVPLSVLHAAWGATYARCPSCSALTMGSLHAVWQGASLQYHLGQQDFFWDVAPFTAGGQLYVPLRELMEPMGALVTKEQSSGTTIVAYSTQWQKEPWLRQAQLNWLGQTDRIPVNVKSVPGQAKVVAFTFDDNWDPEATLRIARLFQQYNGHCTFFIVGTEARAHPEVIREIVRLGDDLGNHTFSHPAATSMTDAVFAKQIQACEQVLNGMGVTSRPFFRFPYLAQNSHVMQIVTDQGYVTIGSAWTIEDTGPNRSVAHSLATIRRFISPGTIFVAHPNSMMTYKVMQSILPELAARGYRFVSVSELLNGR